MISKVERNRIIRLKRQANYMRSRAENDELTKKQRTLALANANAISWAVDRTIAAIENREKEAVRDKWIDMAIRWLRIRKYGRRRSRFDQVEAMVRDLYASDIMEHEKTYDGLAVVLEHSAAKKRAKVEVAE